jgi:hypothetical protein
MSAQPSSSDLSWRKATASGANGCVEVAPLPDGGVAIRDSKDPAGPVLSFTRHEWLSFLDGLHRGDFSQLLR